MNKQTLLKDLPERLKKQKLSVIFKFYIYKNTYIENYISSTVLKFLLLGMMGERGSAA